MARPVVRFLNLSVPDADERLAMHQALDRVFDHGQLITGPEVLRLEEKVARFCGRRFAIGLSSGTDALHLGLRCLGIAEGDEVITTPMSFVATGHAILMTGARPVFADVRDDLNLDPASLPGLLTARTRAIIPVHLNGKMCPMDPIMAWAQEHGLHVIEDASQAFGATYQGRPAGAFGETACFSLNSMKVLAALGEAGIVVTDNAEALERLAQLRYLGIPDRESAFELSSNHRLDTVQAAFLLCRLERLEASMARRRQIAMRYHEAFQGLFELPLEEPGSIDAFYTYTIRTDHREGLRLYLDGKGVETRVRHPLLIPEHPLYRGRFEGSYPNAKRQVDRMLCIPCHDKLTDEQVEYVCQATLSFAPPA